jgi:hypothetical protein
MCGLIIRVPGLCTYPRSVLCTGVIKMPVEKVGSGYRWGKHGKIYYGKDAKSKAAAQGRAAYSSGYKGKKKGKRSR